MRVLMQRMDGRGSETEESKKKRIETGLKEVAEARRSGGFKFLVCY